MKRIYIAVFLILFSVIFCLWEQMEIKNFYTNVSILTTDNKIENHPLDSAKKIKQLWLNKNDTLYAFSQHDLLEHLAENIEQIDNLQNEEETKKALKEIRAQNKVYYENHRMTFSNIF